MRAEFDIIEKVRKSGQIGSIKMMRVSEITEGLMKFLDESPVALFAAENIRRILLEQGYTECREGTAWNLVPGGKYFVTRNGSAVIAFRIPSGAKEAGYHIAASHLDSPTFRIKSNAEIVVENRYVTLNVEKYGGMLLAPWLDRPLSVAGRVIVRTGDGIETRLLNIDRDLMIIPNVAIHMNREINNGYKWDMKQDLRPLLAGDPDLLKQSGASGCDSAEDGGITDGENGRNADPGTVFRRLIAEETGVSPEDIVDTDLYLYNREKACVLGLSGEFISSGRLDDLQCAYGTLRGFLAAEPSERIAVYCAFDNEEVGSMTKQGADSSFLRCTLERISAELGRSREEFMESLTSSFMISADNAHAVHPNHPELEDPSHRPVPNGGIVIKYSANQKYTTDAVSGAVMKEICRKAGVPVQMFYNRSDLLGGSTLGNLSTSQLSLNTVDVGLAQLAMHSSYETAGVKDTEYLARACEVFFSGSVRGKGDGNYQLKF